MRGSITWFRAFALVLATTGPRTVPELEATARPSVWRRVVAAS